MRPRLRLRGIVKRIALLAAGLLGAALAHSRWYGTLWQSSACDRWVGLQAGKVAIGNRASGVPSEFPGWYVCSLPSPRLEWDAAWSFHGWGDWWVVVPLWAPLGAALALAASAWTMDQIAFRRARANLCTQCRYDRTGLSTSARCPECGAGVK